MPGILPMPLKFHCPGGVLRKPIINMGWIEFIGVYLFGIVTGIILFGFVYVVCWIDEIKITNNKGERDENKNNKTSRKGLR